MGMNDQCKFCIHRCVCAYKEHYEDALKLYEKVRAECLKYTYFKCKIGCAQYRKDDSLNQPIQMSMEEKTRWVPVTEGLPKAAGVYRVTKHYLGVGSDGVCSNNRVDACFFDGSNTWYNEQINYDKAYADNVIAWEENPEPYKVDSQESEDK